jgi:hypothetical protein
MNEIAKEIGLSLQGMKGPEVLLVIASILSMPICLYLVMEAVKEVKRRNRK